MTKNILAPLAVMAASLAFVGCTGAEPKTEKKTEVVTRLAADPCALPTQAASTPEQTAWQLFVAINCPTGDAKKPRVWETWTEQTCILSPRKKGCGPTASKRTLHGSELARRLSAVRRTRTVPISDECTPMLTAATAVGVNAPLKRFVPPNLSANPVFCEEVFVNGPELAYVNAPAPGYTLRDLTSQNAYVASGATINFPTSAVEVKADWVPVSSFTEFVNPDGTKSPAFDCAKPPPGLLTETIDGTCYGLAGMHISSKLYPNWDWSTFEPQFFQTNPNRCDSSLYSACIDSFGSNPAKSQGDDTALTPVVSAMMRAAKLPAALANYRLTGAQTDYVNATVTALGNSFVEFNAQVLPHQASCITCHNSARFDNSTTPPTPGGGEPPKGSVNIGGPTPQPPNLVPDDFSWFLNSMPASPPPAAASLTP